ERARGRGAAEAGEDPRGQAQAPQPPPQAVRPERRPGAARLGAEGAAGQGLDAIGLIVTRTIFAVGRARGSEEPSADRFALRAETLHAAPPPRRSALRGRLRRAARWGTKRIGSTCRVVQCPPSSARPAAANLRPRTPRRAPARSVRTSVNSFLPAARGGLPSTRSRAGTSIAISSTSPALSGSGRCRNSLSAS